MQEPLPGKAAGDHQREAPIEERRCHDTVRQPSRAQRIPELDAAPEQREGPVTASEDRSDGEG